MSCSYARCSSEQSDSLEMYTKTAKDISKPSEYEDVITNQGRESSETTAICCF